VGGRAKEVERWRGGEVERWRGGGEVLSNFQEIKSRWLPLDAGRAAQIQCMTTFRDFRVNPAYDDVSSTSKG
jgi:hypothetical protein